MRSLCRERGRSCAWATSPFDPEHAAPDPEVALVEFDMVGESVRRAFRQAMVDLLRVRGGRALLLREFVDTAGLNELMQSGG